MHIKDIIQRDGTTFSFEFFPPKSEEAEQRFYKAVEKLEELKPSYVSVTYGAGGTTRDKTIEVVTRLHQQTALDPVPHLTSVCHQAHEIETILEQYANLNISNILALGGDPPRDKPDHDRDQDAFRYAADLVSFIRKFNESGRHPDPRGFGIGAAGFPEGHPATPNRLEELDHLKAKADAGADYICTQLFFDNHDFHDFRERCRIAGIDIPIIAGILPITSKQGLRRMGDLAAGSRFPAPLLKALDRCDDDDTEAVTNVGVHWATEQVRDLLDNDVDGIHFYTLNKAEATTRIFHNLGVSTIDELRPPGHGSALAEARG